MNSGGSRKRPVFSPSTSMKVAPVLASIAEFDAAGRRAEGPVGTGDAAGGLGDALARSASSPQSRGWSCRRTRRAARR